jgi:hypothetical protein
MKLPFQSWRTFFSSLGMKAVHPRPGIRKNHRLACETLESRHMLSGVVGMFVTNAAATESGTQGSFVVTRTGTFNDSITVYLGYTGTAAYGTDYTAPSSVALPSGHGSTYAFLTPVDDSIVEGTESATISIMSISGSGYTVDSSQSSGTITIEDNDSSSSSVVISVEASDGSASEEINPSTDLPDPGVFTISRTGSSSSSLTVYFELPLPGSSSTGIATHGEDYEELYSSSASSGSVVIPANSLEATVTIRPDDDHMVEGLEMVHLNILGGSGYQISTSSGSAYLTLNDNDEVPTINVEATDPVAGEIGPDAGVFTIMRSGFPAAELVVNYTMSGSATNGSDYVQLSGAITIPAGSNTGTIILTPILDATHAEGVEIATLTLSTSSNFTVGPQSSASIEIDDAYMAISVSSQTMDEDSGVAVHLVQLQIPPTSPLLVNYSTMDGSAVAGEDYEATSGQLQFAIGETTKSIYVPIIDDEDEEDSENYFVVVELDNDSSINDFGTGTITDDDQSAPTTNQAPYFSQDPFYLEVDALAPADTLVGAILAIDPDSDPLTYSIIGTVPFSIDADTGEIRTTQPLNPLIPSYQFQIQAVDPESLQASTTVNVTLGTNHAPVINTSPEAVIDQLPAQLRNPRTIVADVYTSAATPAIIATATATDQDQDTLTWSLTTILDAPLTIDSATGAITVTAHKRSSLNLWLGNVTVDDGRGGVDSVHLVVRIVKPVVTLEKGPASEWNNLDFATERGLTHGTLPANRTPSFVVTRTGPTDKPLNVALSFTGSATFGDDYKASKVITILAGQASKPFTITIVDDPRIEGPEHIKMEMWPSLNSGYDADYTMLDIVILDNDLYMDFPWPAQFRIPHGEAPQNDQSNMHPMIWLPDPEATFGPEEGYIVGDSSMSHLVDGPGDPAADRGGIPGFDDSYLQYAKVNKVYFFYEMERIGYDPELTTSAGAKLRVLKNPGDASDFYDFTYSEAKTYTRSTNVSYTKSIAMEIAGGLEDEGLKGVIQGGTSDSITVGWTVEQSVSYQETTSSTIELPGHTIKALYNVYEVMLVEFDFVYQDDVAWTTFKPYWKKNAIWEYRTPLPKGWHSITVDPGSPPTVW